MARIMYNRQLFLCLNQNLTFSTLKEIKNIFGKYYILLSGPQGLGGGVFVWPISFSQKAKVSSGFHINTLKYNVCGIKPETKVMRLHKTWV